MQRWVAARWTRASAATQDCCQVLVELMKLLYRSAGPWTFHPAKNSGTDEASSSSPWAGHHACTWELVKGRAQGGCSTFLTHLGRSTIGGQHGGCRVGMVSGSPGCPEAREVRRAVHCSSPAVSRLLENGRRLRKQKAGSVTQHCKSEGASDIS